MTDLDELEDKLPTLTPDSAEFRRIYHYFSELYRYLPEDEQHEKYRILYDLAKRCNNLPYALFIAIRVNDPVMIKEIYELAPEGSATRAQISYILGNTGIVIEGYESDEIMTGMRKFQIHKDNGERLDITEPKSPGDVYKSHLVETKTVAGLDPMPRVDSALENLANSFVSGIVNAGFLTDTLLTKESEHWIFRHKEAGITCAIASIGLLNIWNPHNAATTMTSYVQSNSDWAAAGALLGLGISTCGVQDEFDPTLALIQEHVNAPEKIKRCCTILGAGIAYCHTNRADLDWLTGLLVEEEELLDVVACTALASGMVNAGTADPTISEAMFMSLAERDANSPLSKLIAVGIGLLFLGRKAECQTIVETTSILPDPIKDFAAIIIQSCAYAGTGDVLVIQKFLGEVAEGKGIAALGVALVAMGEKLGSEMALRHFERMIQFSTPEIKPYIAVGLGLLSVGNPTFGVLPFLSKMTHDANPKVCVAAMLSLGMMAAGTNNGATAKLLRELTVFHQQNPQLTFVARLALGMVHLGKGSLTLNPVCYDGKLIRLSSMVGLILFSNVILTSDELLLKDYPFLFFLFTPAIHPRVVTTVTPDGTFVPVSLRLGQAVDFAGLPGNPNVVTGFQTMKSPCVLQAGQRVQFVDTDHTVVTDIVDDVMVVDEPKSSESTTMLLD
ncbi:putative 26S proteasome non-ATPase regulatory subunit 2 [Blattamonas nauphoetae]|uniref:26S proteasome non-ATPase regulatory subunit 2 n=1 Tax=Blattamonas nauphoetae TaxID=2049346 RepID=A0ABQ9XC35_9EUKA|nr:putative 26S proteasome non-ATPase regulatory subunit 2 [Blattamonas nauphoetae]